MPLCVGMFSKTTVLAVVLLYAQRVSDRAATGETDDGRGRGRTCATRFAAI